MRFLAFLSTFCLLFGLWLSLAQPEEDDWPEPPFPPEAIGILAELPPDKARTLLQELEKLYSEGEGIYERLESGQLSEDEERRTLGDLRLNIKEYEKTASRDLNEQQIALAKKWGDQPNRYARHVVSHLPVLSQEKRSVLRFLDEVLTSQLNRDREDEEQEGLETRYWILASLLVGRENWAELRASLPHEFRQDISWEDLVTLDGMTGAKANSIWAEINAYEAEMIANNAEIEKLEKALDEGSEDDRSAELEKKLEPLIQEVDQREERLREDILAKLSDEEKQELASLPPGIPLLELVENLELLTLKVDWTPEQNRWLESRQEKIEAEAEKLESKMTMMESGDDEEDPDESGDLTSEVTMMRLEKPFALARLDLSSEAVSRMSRAQLRKFLLDKK